LPDGEDPFPMPVDWQTTPSLRTIEGLESNRRLSESTRKPAQMAIEFIGAGLGEKRRNAWPCDKKICAGGIR
jgi:hypothetical protein